MIHKSSRGTKYVILKTGILINKHDQNILSCKRSHKYVISVLHIYVNINRKQRDKWRKVGATERTISTFTGASLGWVAHISNY